MLFSAEFGEYFVRLPLKKSAKIIHGNALRIDWGSLLIEEQTISIHAWEANVIIQEPEHQYGKVNVFAEKVTITDKPFVDSPQVKFDYIIGNPPFIGKQLQTASQKVDMALICHGVKSAGVLDYVAAWYIKAAQYLQAYNVETDSSDKKTRVAFVSTNSIAQGEQVGIIWNELFSRYKIKIHFAHQTFKWGNEARANAAVHVVIIGFSNFDIAEKYIFQYDDIKNTEPHVFIAKNINSYLVEGKDLIILSRSKPINIVPEIMAGNKAIDGGNFIFNDQEKEDFLKKEPKASKFFKQFLGSEEFINNKSRWCLWLVNADPTELRNMPLVLERIKKC